MRTEISSALAVSVLALLVLSVSAQTVSAAANVSIVDIRGVSKSDKLHFPGSAAYDFHPLVAMVGIGQNVDFVNNGIDPHTVTSYTIKIPMTEGDLTILFPIPDGIFDSGFADLIESGETFTLDTTGLSAGDYTYFCQIHFWMQALLRVVSDPVPEPVVVNMDHSLGTNEHLDQIFAASLAWGFLPFGLAVRQGTQVTFTNTGLIPHTVTSYTIKVPVPVTSDRTFLFPIEDGVFDSDIIAPVGGVFVLDTGGLDPRAYTYFCELHPWMQASLTVV